jgi:hypothetical protein
LGELVVLSDGRAWVRERRVAARGGVNALDVGLVAAWREALRARLGASALREPRGERRGAAAAA